MYSGIFYAALLYNKIFLHREIGFLLPANLIVLFLSLFSLIGGTPDNRWTGGNGLGFMGFAGHQNILAASILLTLPSIFYIFLKFYDQNTRLIHRNKIKHLIISLMIAVNCILMLLTFSRASILSLAIGIIIFLVFNKSKKSLIAVLTLISIVVVLFLIFQPINLVIEQWVQKDGENIFGRRLVLWEPSIEAAKMGGVFGLGYGIYAPGIKTPKSTGSYTENGRYIRETGNSILAIIEQTGWVGLILFIMPIVFSYKKLFFYKRFQESSSIIEIKELTPHKTHSRYIIYSTLGALLVHSQFEGWWVGVGSIHFPIFCMLLFITLTERLQTKDLSIK